MKFIIKLSFFICSTIFYACNQSVEEKQVINNSKVEKQSIITVDNSIDTTFDNSVCETYHNKMDSLDKIKYDLFIQNILNPALNNPKLTAANKNFLLALKKELKLDFKTKSSRYALDHLLLPIFKLEKDKLAIFGNEYYDCKKSKKGTTQCDILNREQQLLNNLEDFRINSMENEEKLISYPSIFKEVMKNRDNQFFVFTKEKQSTATITNFNYYNGACLVYYHYPISTENITQNDNILFASKYPLNLIFEKQPKIDDRLKNDNWQCYDCVYQYEPEIIFARLQGVENLYFAYSDTFNPQKQFDYPKRALIMIIDDFTKVDLWKEDLDLFGCRCL